MMESKDTLKKISELGAITDTAVPFVYASAENFDHQRRHQTDAVRYWKSKESEALFITHIKWEEGCQRYEVSIIGSYVSRR